jgi:hypothetical protein
MIRTRSRPRRGAARAGDSPGGRRAPARRRPPPNATPSAPAPSPSRRPATRPPSRRSRPRSAELAREHERRDPGPQLRAGRDPGRGRSRRRLAPPVARGRLRARVHDRLLRRLVHGRDGQDPLAGQARPAAGQRRRLLARRLDHGRAAARLEGRASRRRRRLVREHDRGRQGGERLLLHVEQRPGRHRRHPGRPPDPLPAGHVPGPVAAARDRPQAHDLARRVPRPRRHPARGRGAVASRSARRRAADPPRVRLHQPGHRGRRRRRPTSSRPRAWSPTPSARRPTPS